MSRGIMAMVLECSNADGLTYDLDKMKKRVLELNDTQLSLYRKARLPPPRRGVRARLTLAEPVWRPLRST